MAECDRVSPQRDTWHQGKRKRCEEEICGDKGVAWQERQSHVQSSGRRAQETSVRCRDCLSLAVSCCSRSACVPRFTGKWMSEGEGSEQQPPSLSRFPFLALGIHRRPDGREQGRTGKRGGKVQGLSLLLPLSLCDCSANLVRRPPALLSPFLPL